MHAVNADYGINHRGALGGVLGTDTELPYDPHNSGCVLEFHVSCQGIIECRPESAIAAPDMRR